MTATRRRFVSRLKLIVGIIIGIMITGAMLWDVQRSEVSPSTASTTNELVIGTDPGFKPFEYKDGSTVVGFDIDLARAIAADQGKTLRVEEMAFDGLLLALQSGRIDMAIAGMTKTEERAKNVDFSDSYYSAAQMIIVKKTSSIRSEADLAHKKIGVQLGTTGDILAHKITGATVVQLPQTASVMQELNASRIDAAIMDNGPASQYPPNNPALRMLPDGLTNEDYAIAIRKGNDTLRLQANKTITAMKKDGRYDALVKKYFGDAQ